jgi:hypothetical protein
MPKPRPPHLHHEETRHGAHVWYVRKGHGPRTRLKPEYGSVVLGTVSRRSRGSAPESEAAKNQFVAVGDRPLSQQLGLGSTFAGDAPTTRKHFQTRHQDCGRCAAARHRHRCDQAGSRAARANATLGKRLYQNHARFLCLGARGKARVDRPDRGHQTPARPE